MLSERATDFRAALGRIRSRKEWGVKAYAARRTALAGRAGPAGQEAPGAGAAYLRRRRDELSAARNARRDAVASAEAVHAALSRLAAETRLHPPQAPQLTGNTAPMILNAAYLLDEQRDGDFAAAVAHLAEQHADIRLQLTGPWPPYSFAGDETGLPDGAALAGDAQSAARA
jgi:hypothetical protein